MGFLSKMRPLWVQVSEAAAAERISEPCVGCGFPHLDVLRLCCISLAIHTQAIPLPAFCARLWLAFREEAALPWPP